MIHSVKCLVLGLPYLSGGEIDLRSENLSTGSFAVCKSADIEKVLLEGEKVVE